MLLVMLVTLVSSAISMVMFCAIEPFEIHVICNKEYIWFKPHLNILAVFLVSPNNSLSIDEEDLVH